MGPDLKFYSIAFNKLYTIRRFSSGKSLFGPVGGYLLTGQVGNADSFSLLNPLNNSDVSLPVLHDSDPYLFSKRLSWFIPASFHIDDYVLAVGFVKSICCKPGDDRWDIIGAGHEYQYRCYYFHGLLYMVDGYTKVTKIMDISSCRELYVIQSPKYENMSNMPFAGPYLVESLWRDFECLL